MNIGRKNFLRRLAAGTVGALAVPHIFKGDPIVALPEFDDNEPEAFWASVRDQFSLSRYFTYFNTGGLGAVSEPVRQAVERTARQLQDHSETGHSLFEDARVVLARFLGAGTDEVAFVRNATEANSIIAAGVRLSAGDEVILESHAHPGGSFPWLNQQSLRGITVRVFEPDNGDPHENVARIAALITPRTKVIQVSHVTAPTGIVMPVAEIAALCRGRGIWFHIDGAQSAGMFPFDLRQIGCDSYAMSGHKWLCGPIETGVLYIRAHRMNDVMPSHVGAYSAETTGLPGNLSFTEGARRHEYGTRNAAAIEGLAEAVLFQEGIGRERIAARGRELAERVRAGLSQIDGIEILTPSVGSLCASMITFRTAQISFETLFSTLRKEHSIRCRPVSEQGLNALRVSTHIFNSPAQCDALVSAVARILRRST